MEADKVEDMDSNMSAPETEAGGSDDSDERSDESGDRDEEEQGGWGGASRNESVLAEEMPPKDLERLGFSSDLKECKNLEPWGFRLWVYRYWVHNAEEETFLQLGNEKFGEDWALTGTTTCRAMIKILKDVLKRVPTEPPKSVAIAFVVVGKSMRLRTKLQRFQVAASVKQVKARFPEAAEAVGKKCESGEKGGQAEAGGESTGEEQESGALGKGEGGKQAAAKDKPAEKSIGGGFRKPLGKATRRAVGGQSAAGGKSSREGVKPGVLGKRQAGKEAAGKDQPAKRATRGAIGSARGQGKSGDDGDDDPEVMFLGSPKSAVVGGKGGKDTSALGDVNKETVDLPEAKGMAKIGKGDTGRAGGVKGGDLRLSLGGAGKEAAAEGERQGATTMGLANEVKTLSKENGALSAKVKSLDKEKATLAAKVKTLSEEKAALDGAMNAVKEALAAVRRN